MRSCAGSGALGGGRRGRGATCGWGSPAKGLDRAGDGEALNGPLVQGLLPGFIHPPLPNGFLLGDVLQLAPGALRLHPPLFLPAEEAQFPMGPPHQGPPRPVKISACVKSPAPIGSGMEERRFPGRGFCIHAPPVCRHPPPPLAARGSKLTQKP